jgi:hypothetical protein
MTDDNTDDDWTVSLTNYLTRRRVVAAGGGAVAGLAGLAVASSREASADVSVDDVTVSDANFEAASADPVIEATIPYSYSVPSVTELIVELLVDGDAVASESLRTDTAELSNSTTLTGRVVDSSAWSLSDFDAVVGETVTHDVTVGVRLTVLDGETVQAEASAEQTATVEVSNPQQGTASVGLQASFSNAER